MLKSKMIDGSYLEHTDLIVYFVFGVVLSVFSRRVCFRVFGLFDIHVPYGFVPLCFDLADSVCFCVQVHVCVNVNDSKVHVHAQASGTCRY